MSNLEKIIFSKYANERADRFALRTDIVEQGNGNFVVRKKTLGQEAIGHVENIYTLGEALNAQYANSRFTFNRCMKIGDSLELEYIKSETLAERADKLLYAGRVEETSKFIFEVIDEVYKVGEKQKFQSSAEFEEVFGKVDVVEATKDDELVCAKVSDIDILLSNIMQGEKWIVIDYEWSFAFPIPLKFIAYRLIHYYLQGNRVRGGILDEAKMLVKADISDSELEAYKQMEQHFQEEYVLTNTDKSHHITLRDMNKTIGKGRVDVRELYEVASNMPASDKEHQNLIMTLENRTKMYGEYHKLKEQFEQQEEKITAMEGTKVWKAYRKYRDMKEK